MALPAKITQRIIAGGYGAHQVVTIDASPDQGDVGRAVRFMTVEAGKDIVVVGITKRILKDPGASAGGNAVVVTGTRTPVDLNEISPQGRAVYGVGRIMAVRAQGDIIRRVCPARRGID